MYFLWFYLFGGKSDWHWEKSMPVTCELWPQTGISIVITLIYIIDNNIPIHIANWINKVS